MKLRVMLPRLSWDSEAYCRGLIKFVAWGEKMTPASRDITIHFSAGSRPVKAVYRDTDELQIDRIAP